uniref:Uncharacterized protein n=1 Tax=Salvator merianae TaxID=96440 RepID=A0A8D0BS49_SALMN
MGSLLTFSPCLSDQWFVEGLFKSALFSTKLLSPYYRHFPTLKFFSKLLDMRHFSPEELSVKVVGDHTEVHSKHEEIPFLTLCNLKFCCHLLSVSIHVSRGACKVKAQGFN